MRRQLVERELTSVGPSRRAPQRGGRRVTVNLAESPLTWLHSRGHLSDAQFDAGERLRADWERAARLQYEVSQTVAQLAEAERAAAERGLLAVTGSERLLDADPDVQRSLARRAPDLDALSRIQVRLLAQLRASSDEGERMELAYLVRLSVSGVAAGLRNTG